jgi:iron complex outermembrane receptor protein
MKKLLINLIFFFMLINYLEAESLIQTKAENDIFTTREIIDSNTCDTLKTTKNPFNKNDFIAWQDLIKGRISGVQITPNNGNPGSNFSILMRGSASLNREDQPLVYLDGVPIATNSNNFGNLLSTINPKDIESIQFLKNATETVAYGFDSHKGVILIKTKEARTKQKLDISFSNSASFSFYKNHIDVLTADEYRSEMIKFLEGNEEKLSLLGNANTDWQDEIYQTAFGRNHYLSIEGNISNFKYRLGYGITNKDGVLKNSNYKRNSINLNISKEFFKKSLRVGFLANISGVNEKVGDEEAISDAYQFDPTQAANENSSGYQNTTVFNPFYINPLWRINKSKNKLTTNQDVWQLNAKYNFPFLKNLSLSALVSKSIMDSNREKKFERVVDDYNPNFIENLGYRMNTNLQKLALAHHLNLKGFISKITTGIYYQNQTDRLELSEERRRNFLEEKCSRLKRKLKSYGGNANIELLGKYSFGAVYRKDKNKESDYYIEYSGIDFEWILSKEKFLSESVFKLRGSYGLLGKNNMDNSYLVSERHHAANIAIDFTSFNNRLSTTIEYYDLRHKDLIGRIPIFSEQGEENYIIDNFGYVSNKGLELSVFAEPIVSKQLKWIIEFTASYNKNKLDKLADGINNLLFQEYVNSIGESLHHFKFHEQIYDKNGKPMDRGKDGAYSENHSVKNSLPDYLLGLYTQLNYKNWDLALNARANLGHYIYNQIDARNGYYLALPGNITKDAFNSGFRYNNKASDYYIQKASFVQLDNLELGYRLNDILHSKLQGRLYFSAQNLLTISSYEGLNPEAYNGIDYNNYPQPRTFVFGLTIDI